MGALLSAWYVARGWLVKRETAMSRAKSSSALPADRLSLAGLTRSLDLPRPGSPQTWVQVSAAARPRTVPTAVSRRTTVMFQTPWSVWVVGRFVRERVLSPHTIEL